MYWILGIGQHKHEDITSLRPKGEEKIIELLQLEESRLLFEEKKNPKSPYLQEKDSICYIEEIAIIFLTYEI